LHGSSSQSMLPDCRSAASPGFLWSAEKHSIRHEPVHDLAAPHGRRGRRRKRGRWRYGGKFFPISFSLSSSHVIVLITGPLGVVFSFVFRFV
jgi:hypothetical protein